MLGHLWISLTSFWDGTWANWTHKLGTSAGMIKNMVQSQRYHLWAVYLRVSYLTSSSLQLPQMLPDTSTTCASKVAVKIRDIGKAFDRVLDTQLALNAWCMMSLQLCPYSWGPMNFSSQGSSVHVIFFSKNTGVGCRALFQGISPVQGSNPCLLHWQADSLPPAPPGKP